MLIYVGSSGWFYAKCETSAVRSYGRAGCLPPAEICWATWLHHVPPAEAWNKFKCLIPKFHASSNHLVIYFFSVMFLSLVLMQEWFWCSWGAVYYTIESEGWSCFYYCCPVVLSTYSKVRYYVDLNRIQHIPIWEWRNSLRGSRLNFMRCQMTNSRWDQLGSILNFGSLVSLHLLCSFSLFCMENH